MKSTTGLIILAAAVMLALSILPFVSTGATAASSVSSVSNSDGSLTISPTTGAVVASLNVGHSNTWTTDQVIGVAGGTPLTLTDGVHNIFKLSTVTSASALSIILLSPQPVTVSGTNDAVDSLELDTPAITLTTSSSFSHLFGTSVFIGKNSVTDSNAITVTDVAALYVNGNPGCAGAMTCTNTWAAYFAGNTAVTGHLNVGGGTSIVYRCTTAGNDRVGVLTTVQADCGASVDTGLRVP